LISVLYGSEWSASRPGRFIPKKRAPDTHCIGGWVGPRAGLDAVVNPRVFMQYIRSCTPYLEAVSPIPNPTRHAVLTGTALPWTL
jgi:hypothetical protein